MALRLSRLFTGRAEVPQVPGPLPRLARLRHRVRRSALRRARACPACPDAVAAQCVAVPPNDLNRVEDALKTDAQIGAVILEPTGGHWGAVPIRGAFLKGLRELCTKHDRAADLRRGDHRLPRRRPAGRRRTTASRPT